MRNSKVNNRKLVLIGGGTGSFTLLRKLKDYPFDITAVVNMSDDGGSTGVLRDELGVLPPGDIRQCLVALADESSVLRDLFNYRFEEGGLKGHSFGNLFLSALEKTSKDFGEAVAKASKILSIKGKVLPVTLNDSHLVLTSSDGVKISGEFAVSQTSWKKGNLPNLDLEPKSHINPKAQKAINEADLIVIAPGHLYGSLAPALLVNGVGKALNKTKAKKIFVCNLVTKPGQTDGFTVENFASEINRFAGYNILDFVIYNSQIPSNNLLKQYAKDGEKPVVCAGNKDLSYTIISADLLSSEIYNQNKADTMIERTLIRHDGDKVAQQILKILKA